MKCVILTIDPGMNTGVTAWEASSWDTPIVEYIETKLFKHKEKSWEKGAQSIAQQIKEWAEKFEVVKLYIEFPQAFMTSMGMSALARGDIFKLVFVIGCIHGVFIDSEFEPVYVSKWKGNLPKKEVERRCKKYLPKFLWVDSDHEWDSIGIAYYLKGLL